MKISDERIDRIRDLKIGETFLYANELYMKSTGNRFVCLNNGETICIDDNAVVTPVEVECKIVR